MAVDPPPPQGESGEAHPDLEGDASLLRDDRDRSRFLRRFDESLECCHHLRLAAREMLVQPAVAAEMELVAVREGAPTLRTLPERLHLDADYDSDVATLGIMIEGQEGLSWDRWRQLCRDVEALGFASLRRSEHLISLMGDDSRDCIDCWTSLALAAEWTKTIQFGPMVSPMTFHHAAVLARQAAAVDVLSGGRLIFGVGAGWNEREHEMFGVPFLTTKERMDLFERGVARIHDTWKKSNPKPVRNTIPLLMGGVGEKRALPLVAREAAEWNYTRLDHDEYRQKREVINRCCKEIGRDPSSIRYSVMANYLIGRDHDELRHRAVKLAEIVPRLKRDSPDEIIKAARQSAFVGTPEEVAEQMRAYAGLGVDLFMLQHFLLDDRDALQLLASNVMPAVA